ncbi:F-box domain containing protein [Pyrenophora tritici-repentis]|uniref:F-box domain containing protein n=2 Tax=Pyrenophora tritici-repentis TaxID=45151 RepID=A0A2W1ENH6_9PLEO|nr:F-box domain containing protein [Pyrenophora tritici-repentis Pt-1C-BFP]KAA8620277.1 F-box domain-containing protein [Pyrenophora tritici-repentis]EDU46509.1 F-box domain containing protein [Pyrenophora tritici-repentis Pt-1C-BFP]KAF7448430.1 F-box domain containing protein [Pyrenophora tritici-repentis]KAF7572151.1 F-box domain containing protein [Pyrenophora tritici-repentis]KAG9384671.1 F-box domain containing protein [Pyrenophora tritici-repentis]
MKRAHEDDDGGERPAKTQRLTKPDRISRLSEELLVRILSFVPVSSLLRCQRVSKKLSRLSVDSELWKAAYYRAFVLPRASRIPGIRDLTNPNRLHYSSRLSKWLEDSYLVKDGSQTNWKQQYRLRHNWTQGQCAVSEIVVAERPPDPPLLVIMSNRIVYAADSISGLRAWSSKNGRELLASTGLWGEAETPRLPISMAIDASEGEKSTERVVIGFEDGSFSIYSLTNNHTRFKSLFTHPPSTNGMLSALAYSSPYLLTMTEDHLLSLYAFEGRPDARGILKAPKLLYSLRSHTAWPPVSLSLRTTAASMTAAIAYSLPTYLSGWTVGVQELRLSHEGELLESRLATAADEHSFTLSACRLASSSVRPASPSPGSAREHSVPSVSSNSKPTSMSYSHPYLLVAHPDNTLALYLVRSTSSALSIGSGNRLWGHTSSISGAHVGMRGKAVSVSRLGNELRVWDLEGGMNSSANRKRSRNGDLSVRVQPSKFGDEDAQDDESGSRVGLRFALEQGFDDESVSHGWVGFDEQNVIVLRQKSEGSQALVVYDFT